MNRLRLMSAGEVAWRIRGAVRNRARALGLGLVRNPPPAERYTSESMLFNYMEPPDDTRRAILAEADALLEGRWDVFAMTAAQLGFPPDWLRDPRTGVKSPLRLGTSIDYRDESLVGDIKYLWEPSRHLQLVTLAAAARISGDARYEAGAMRLITSWLDQCPYPFSVHWASSLELAIRLVNWAFAWQLLGGENATCFSEPAGAAIRERWLASVFQHAHFIERNLSAHSSANNHLFGELLGLYIAGTVWPRWAESERWSQAGVRGLEREAIAQTHADGVNREQAIYYHHEVLEMMILSERLAAASGQKLSDAFSAQMLRMAEFIAALRDVGGYVPMIGDSDDAHILRLDPCSDGDVYAPLLSYCGLRFNRPDLLRKAVRLDWQTMLLFGPEAEARRAALLPADGPEVRLDFPEGGYFVLGSDLNGPAEVRAVFDAGPLGYLTIAAHGHADALSLVMSAQGHPLLVDPGTYAYHTQKRWRDYFRGTSAHNTVRVDGVDQSQIGGNFMWLRKARATVTRLERGANEQTLEAWHDGYLSLPDPVRHARRVVYDARTQRFEVTDILECAGQHEVELFWHFDDRCSVQEVDGGVLASVGDVTLSLRSMDAAGRPLSANLLAGDDTRPLGWISRRFDEKMPSPTFVSRLDISGTTRISTTIRLILG